MQVQKIFPASKLKEIFSWINPEGLETATYTDNKIEGLDRSSYVS